MTNLTLAKTDLPDDFIQAAVGEPYLVRDNLFAQYDILKLSPDLKKSSIFEYTKPAGYDPLVKFLEDKYQAPVIIHGGAKQAIGSLFYAIKNKNPSRPGVYLKKPFWSLFPPLLRMHDLWNSDLPYTEYVGGHLLVSPENPTGEILLDDWLEENAIKCKELDIPIIMDSAYYNPIYMDPSTRFKPLGDVQVFTCSKLLGLSQLRIGYSVFHNTQLYKAVLTYQEHMTVGTSILSQMFALNIFQEMERDLSKMSMFQAQCNYELDYNRRLAAKIDPSILEIKTQNVGMFLWAQCHDMKAFDECKITVADGESFGAKNHIRMNLGLPTNKIQEIVERLNNYARIK